MDRTVTETITCYEPLNLNHSLRYRIKLLIEKIKKTLSPEKIEQLNNSYTFSELNDEESREGTSIALALIIIEILTEETKENDFFINEIIHLLEELKPNENIDDYILSIQNFSIQADQFIKEKERLDQEMESLLKVLSDYENHTNEEIIEVYRSIKRILLELNNEMGERETHLNEMIQKLTENVQRELNSLINNTQRTQELATRMKQSEASFKNLLIEGFNVLHKLNISRRV